MSPGYIEKLSLKIQKTNIGASKIDNFILTTFEIVIANFKIENKANRLKFF